MNEICPTCGDTTRYKNNRCVSCSRTTKKRYAQSAKGKKRRTEYRRSRLAIIKAIQQTPKNKAYMKAYWQSPKGKAVLKVAQQKNRAKRLNSEGFYTTQEWLDLKAHYDYRCLCCGRHESEIKSPLEQDHVVPISKGGTNWITNIQPLCESCNGMGGKGTKSTDYRSKSSTSLRACQAPS